MSIKNHPYLRQVEQQDQKRLAEFMEKITGNKLNTEDKKTKKDIEQSKATFTKVEKGVQVKVVSQNRTYRPKIIDDSQSKMQKKTEKAIRKDIERQQMGASGVATDKKQSFKDKHMKYMKKHEKERDDQSEQPESEEYEDDVNELDQDVQARRQLNKMLGWAKSQKYRKRDNEQIIESRPDQIQRQEKISRLIGQKEDQQEEMQERMRRQMKKMKKLKRAQQNSDDEDKSAERPKKPRDDQDRDD